MYIKSYKLNSFFSFHTVYAASNGPGDSSIPFQRITDSSISVNSSTENSIPVQSSIDGPIPTQSPTKLGTSSNSDGSTSAGNALIMTASITTGANLVTKDPNIATKSAIVAGSVGIGPSAILVKKVSENISSEVGKSSLVLFAITNLSFKESSDKYPSTLTEYLYQIFDLTGDSILDLLKMIDYLNNLQYLFLYVIIYLSILLSINSSYIESTLNKILPNNFVLYFMKSVNLVKKSGRIYIIILFLLLSYNIYLSNYCFSLLYENFDAICELHQSRLSSLK